MRRDEIVRFAVEKDPIAGRFWVDVPPKNEDASWYLDEDETWENVAWEDATQDSSEDDRMAESSSGILDVGH